MYIIYCTTDLLSPHGYSWHKLLLCNPARSVIFPKEKERFSQWGRSLWKYLPHGLPPGSFAIPFPSSDIVNTLQKCFWKTSRLFPQWGSLSALNTSPTSALEGNWCLDNGCATEHGKVLLLEVTLPCSISRDMMNEKNYSVQSKWKGEAVFSSLFWDHPNATYAATVQRHRGEWALDL